MAKKPDTKTTQIPVKRSPGRPKKIAVRQRASVVTGVEKKKPIPQVQPAFATEEKAPAKRPLGRPRNEVGALTKANAKLQKQVDDLKGQLRVQSYDLENAQQDAADYRTLIKRIRRTVAGRYLVHRAKRHLPGVNL